MLELAVPEQQSSILGVPGKKQRTSAVPSMLSVCPGPHRTVTFSKQNLRVESSTSASLALFTSSAPKSGKSSRTPAPRITCTVLGAISANQQLNYIKRANICARSQGRVRELAPRSRTHSLAPFLSVARVQDSLSFLLARHAGTWPARLARAMVESCCESLSLSLSPSYLSFFRKVFLHRRFFL